MLHSWDLKYYEQIAKQQLLQSQKVKLNVFNYFPIDHIIKTTLEIYQELLSLEFNLLPNV